MQSGVLNMSNCFFSSSNISDHAVRNEFQKEKRKH